MVGELEQTDQGSPQQHVLDKHSIEPLGRQQHRLHKEGKDKARQGRKKAGQQTGVSVPLTRESILCTGLSGSPNVKVCQIKGNTQRQK